MHEHLKKLKKKIFVLGLLVILFLGIYRVISLVKNEDAIAASSNSQNSSLPAFTSSLGRTASKPTFSTSNQENSETASLPPVEDDAVKEHTETSNEEARIADFVSEQLARYERQKNAPETIKKNVVSLDKIDGSKSESSKVLQDGLQKQLTASNMRIQELEQKLQGQEHLEAENTALQNELLQLKEVYGKEQEANEKANEKDSQAIKLLQAAETEEQKLRDELAAKKTHLNELEVKLQEQDNVATENKSIKEEIVKLKKAYSQEQEQHQKSEELSKRQSDNLDLAVKKITSLLEERTTLRERVSALEKEIDEKGKEQDQLLKIIHMSRSLLGARSKENTKLKEELEAASQKVETLRRQIDEVGLKGDNREELVGLHQEELTSRDEQISKLKGELQLAAKKLIGLQKLLENAEEEKEKIRKFAETNQVSRGVSAEENKKLREEVSGNSKKVASLKEEVTKLSGKLTALEKDREGLFGQVKKQESQLKSKQEALLEVKQQLKKSNEKNSEYASKLEQEKAVTKQLSQLEEEKKQLQEELEKVKITASSVTQLQRELTQVKNQLLLKDTELRTLQGNASAGSLSSVPKTSVPDSMTNLFEVTDGWKDNVKQNTSLGEERSQQQSKKETLIVVPAGNFPRRMPPRKSVDNVSLTPLADPSFSLRLEGPLNARNQGNSAPTTKVGSDDEDSEAFESLKQLRKVK